jgi:hypothetical protein
MGLMGLWVWAWAGNLYAVKTRGQLRPGNSAEGIRYEERPPIENYLSVMQKRQMFKPGVFYATKPKEVTNILADFSFLGVMRNGSQVRAFIQNSKTNSATLYSVNESLGDVVVKEIYDDRVVLQHGEEVLQLTK